MIYLQEKIAQQSAEQDVAGDEGRQYQHVSHLTKSFLHHEELSPVAQRFTDKRIAHQMPSEAT